MNYENILIFILITIIIILLILISLFIYIINYNNCKKIDGFVNIKNEPIDVVYTWVNTYDKDWVIEKNKYLEKGIKTDNSKKRWTMTKNPFDEIELSIRSVRKFLPWVNNIYIVTMRPQKIPDNLINEFNITTVYHDEIFENMIDLPTFSSHAIEGNLHRIPNLSNNFIYFNDDTYINNYLKDTDFFINNIPIFRYSNFRSMLYNFLPNIFNNIHNKSNILNKKILNMVYFCPKHQATPITKKIMYDAEKKFKKEWEETVNNRFRMVSIIPLYISLNNALSNNDVIILKNDNIKTHIMNDYYSNITKILNKVDLLCMNNMDSKQFNNVKKYLLKRIDSF